MADKYPDIIPLVMVRTTGNLVEPLEGKLRDQDAVRSGRFKGTSSNALSITNYLSYGLPPDIPKGYELRTGPIPASKLSSLNLGPRFCGDDITQVTRMNGNRMMMVIMYPFISQLYENVQRFLLEKNHELRQRIGSDKAPVFRFAIYNDLKTREVDGSCMVEPDVHAGLYAPIRGRT